MENELELVMLRGLPGSNKKEVADSMEDNGFVVVTGDNIRQELLDEGIIDRDGIKSNERRNLLVREALENGYSVVSNDLNLDLKNARALKKIAKEYSAEFIIDDSFLAIPLDECIERDVARKNQVGEHFIRDQFSTYILPERSKNLYDPLLDPVYILDIDNVIATSGKKRLYDEWSKVGNDKLNEGVAHLVDAINNMPYAKVFIFSGRDEVCKSETIEWLDKYCIQYDSLSMRKSGDTREDHEVKKDMISEYVAGKYNVMGIFDGNPKSSSQYFEMGYMTFRIGDPYILSDVA